jgi:O-antigen/teichoic acid export membrane protein
MKLVGGAILGGQIIITVLAFTIVQAPDDVYWVPVTRIVGEIAIAGIFLGVYFSRFGRIRLNFPLTRVRYMLKPSSILGLSSGLALMSFNFDTILLGFLSGPQQVGWYSAAYKPVTAGLLIPVTYFLGLFPSISRMFTNNKDEFIETVNRSFRLTAIVAIPFAVAGTFLAEPIILSLFGLEYSPSIMAMQILVWPAALVILRGTLRQSLNAANQHILDLRSALISIICNVGLNLVLIPAYGMIGSSIAYLVSETLWIGLASYFFYQKVHRETLLPFLKIPLIGGTILSVFFLSTPFVFWLIRGVIGIVLYLLVLLIFGEHEMRLLFNRIFLRK